MQVIQLSGVIFSIFTALGSDVFCVLQPNKQTHIKTNYFGYDAVSFLFALCVYNPV